MKAFPTGPQKRAHFTLIELLVVVAIIAILASLLLPALSRARETARSTACLNNLKQSALAFALYAEANDDFPPTGFNGNQRAWYQQTFMTTYNVDVSNGTTRKPYQLPNSSFLCCPSDPNPGVYDIAWSYTANNSVCGWQNSDGTWWSNLYHGRPLRLGGFTLPTQDWVAYDGWGLGGADAGTTANWHMFGSLNSYWVTARSNAVASGRLIVHNFKFNMVFVDGHVWQSPSYPGTESNIIENKPDLYWGEN